MKPSLPVLSYPEEEAHEEEEEEAHEEEEADKSMVSPGTSRRQASWRQAWRAARGQRKRRRETGNLPRPL